MENNPAPVAPKTSNNKKLIIIIAAAVLLIAAAIAVYFLVIKKPTTSDDTSSGEVSEIDPNTPAAEVEVVWGDEEEDNSGEAYVARLEEVISSSASAEEKFDAQLSLANYDIAVENFSAAEVRLLALDTSNFSTEDYFRYYNVLTHLYEESGDTAKRDEYNALSVEYRNRLIAEEGGE